MVLLKSCNNTCISVRRCIVLSYFAVSSNRTASVFHLLSPGSEACMCVLRPLLDCIDIWNDASK